MSQLTALTVFFIVFLCACGSSVQSLDKTQQNRFSNALLGAGKLLSSVQTAGQRHGGRAPTGGQREQDVEEMVAAIERAVTRGDCKVPKPFPTDLGLPASDLAALHPPSLQSVDFSIQGAKCPVSLRLQMVTRGDGKYSTSDYELAYDVRDNSYRGILELDRADLSGKITQAVTAASRDTPFSMESKWTMEGSFHSSVEGTVRTSLSMDSKMSGGPGGIGSLKKDFLLLLGFRDFKGELRANHQMDQKAAKQEIWLNTKQLTPEEFSGLFQFKG